MTVRFHILRERELYVNNDEIEAIYYTADEKNPSFAPSDVIEMKLDDLFPLEGEIDIGVKGESIVIKPIRID